MTKKQQLADPKRRWKDVSKQELDGGQLTQSEREASAMRKNNRAIEGKKKSSKK